MRRFRNILIVILFSTVMLSGCDLPGLGGGSGKNVKLPHLRPVNLKLWHI